MPPILVETEHLTKAYPRTDGESLVLSDDVRTIAHFSAHLEALHAGLRGRLASMRFARNEEFANVGDPVVDGDVIALIPPVAGG